jgi:hypothetical protein
LLPHIKPDQKSLKLKSITGGGSLPPLFDARNDICGVFVHVRTTELRTSCGGSIVRREHQSPAVTEVYLKRDTALAQRVMRRFGKFDGEEE